MEEEGYSISDITFAVCLTDLTRRWRKNKIKEIHTRTHRENMRKQISLIPDLFKDAKKSMPICIDLTTPMA